VKPTRAAARSRVDDADVLRPPTARSTSHPSAHVSDRAIAAQARYQRIEV